VDFKTRVKEICEVISGPVSAEVISTTAEEMLKEADEILTWAPNICIKIPMIPEGLKAVKVLAEKGVKTNVTLIFSPAQALLAAKAGATFVSPFVGRLDDIGHDGMELVSDIIQIFETYGVDTEVIAASIRTPLHILTAMKLGADIVTIPPQFLEKMAVHPLTDKGLEKFLKDWAEMKK
jgi:transaldolase